MAGNARFDLVAVGGGLAGLAAACRAAELGRRALVLEASRDPRHVCASRVNGGIFHVGFLSVDADPEALAQRVSDATSGFVPQQIARAMAENAGRAVHWLRDQGIAFTSMDPDEGWKDWVLAPLGFHESTTMRWEGLGGDAMVDRLEARLASLGGELWRGVRMQALVMEGASCRGVTVAGDTELGEVRADAVVLADGGFHGNPDMLRQFVTRHPENLKLRGTDSGRGDGIRAAQAVGARLLGMDTFYGHLLSADSLHNPSLGCFPFLDFVASAGLLVDGGGERFVDEGRGGHVMANTLTRHGNGLAHAIFDEAIWQGEGRHFFCPPNPNLLGGGGTLLQADNFEDLARLANLPPATLARTVATYQSALADGTPERLTPPRSTKKYRPRPFSGPPFYAAPACAAITHTMGGVAIDAHGRVLDQEDRPIAGLFAAGSTCGGLEGGPDAAYLGGLIKALVFGLLAAESGTGGMARLTPART